MLPFSANFNSMKQKVSLLLVTLLAITCFSSFSQTSTYHRYIIEFTDKNNNPFSTSNPSDFLSQRAIDRRERYNIPITENDLPVTPAYVQEVLNTGVVVLNKSKWLNSVSIQTDDSIALATIGELPFVKSTEPIAPRIQPPGHIQKFEEANYSQKVADNNTFIYGQATNQIDMLHGSSLHERDFRGQGMIIAVLDIGFLNTQNIAVFDSAFDEDRILGWWNFVKGNDSVFFSGSHGTSVLSTIAANIPGAMVGTAPKASFYLFQTEDGNSEYPIEEHNWAVGAEWADSLGVDVITTSLGYSDFDDPVFNHSYADMDGNTTMASRAADFAASKGILVCSSAGNEGNSDWHYITAPGDADSILTTGAVDSSGTITAFSSYGPSSDGDVKPNVVAQGIKATVAEASVGAIVYSSGTSFSNPIMAGMATCLWQAHPEKNNMEIIAAIEKSASLFYDPNDSMGYGIPNFEIADLMLAGKAPGDLDFPQPLVYPNPFSDLFGVICYSNQTEELRVELFDALGRNMESFTTVLPMGYNYIPIDHLRNAADGSYILRLNFDDHSDVSQLIKISN
jgi:subtilisin family serine protease